MKISRSIHAIALLLLCSGAYAPVGFLYSGTPSSAQTGSDHWEPLQAVSPSITERGETVRPTGQDSDQRDAVFVRIVDNRVSVRLQHASLRELLERLAEPGTFRLFIEQNAGDRRISEAFSELDIRQALRRLLEGSTYVISRQSGDDAASILDVRVLAFQTLAPEPVEQSEGQHQTTGAAVQSILESIDPQSLPAGILDDLRAAAGPQDLALGEEIRDRSGEVFDRLLDQLQRRLATDSATLQRLRSSGPLYEGRLAPSR